MTKRTRYGINNRLDAAVIASKSATQSEFDKVIDLIEEAGKLGISVDRSKDEIKKMNKHELAGLTKAIRTRIQNKK